MQRILIINSDLAQVDIQNKDNMQLTYLSNIRSRHIDNNNNLSGHSYVPKWSENFLYRDIIEDMNHEATFSFTDKNNDNKVGTDMSYYNEIANVMSSFNYIKGKDEKRYTKKNKKGIINKLSKPNHSAITTPYKWQDKDSSSQKGKSSKSKRKL